MVKNISINLQRINERVQFGGHDIPEMTVMP
jgi:predicted ABC-type ATPase